MVWLPKWLAFRVNPVPFLVDNFVTAAVKELPVGSIVFDAGAGECRYASLFSHCTYISLDFGKGDPLWNYKRLSVIGDLLSLPLRDEVFDAVICTQTMEHISNPFVLLQGLFRVLKPGGRLFLTAPQIWPIHQSPHDFFRFTYYGLECLFDHAGFVVESIQPHGGYFLYLAGSLSHMHRALFPLGRPFLKRLLLSPLQFFVVFFASFLGPLVLYTLDCFNKNYALNYECKCQKPVSTPSESHQYH